MPCHGISHDKVGIAKNEMKKENHGKITDKWSIFHCHGWLPEENHCINPPKIGGVVLCRPEIFPHFAGPPWALPDNTKSLQWWCLSTWVSRAVVCAQKMDHNENNGDWNNQAYLPPKLRSGMNIGKKKLSILMFPTCYMSVAWKQPCLRPVLGWCAVQPKEHRSLPPHHLSIR